MRDMMYKKVFLSEKQKEILRFLEKRSQRKRIYATDVSFDEISATFHMTRQGMNKHFQTLKKEGFVRVGRGFIDLCEKGKRFLDAPEEDACFIIEVKPNKKAEVVAAIKNLKFRRGELGEEGGEIFMQAEKEYTQDVIRYLQAFDGVVGIKIVGIVEKEVVAS